MQHIGYSLRMGAHADIELERFQEALHDSSAGLTYTALSGVHKQSVEDAERLFSKSLAEWKDTAQRPSILGLFVIGDVPVMKEGYQGNSIANGTMIF